MRDIRRRIVAVFILLVVAGAVLAAVRRPKPGLVLGTVGVGQSPRFAAVDVRTGHAFVVNMGGPQSATVTTTGAAASLAQGSFTPGSVSMIDTRSGTLIRTIDAGESPTAVAVDARHQRAYVLDAGSVYVLDTATGTLLRTISLRGGDDSLTVDPSTGHVYTASYTTGTVSMFDGGTGRLLQVLFLQVKDFKPLSRPFLQLLSQPDSCHVAQTHEAHGVATAVCGSKRLVEVRRICCYAPFATPSGGNAGT